MSNNCPEPYSNVTKITAGIIFMDSCAVLTAFVHPYVVYCIIFRSTPAMKTYRWYLLWHQVWSCAGDIFINVVAKPVIYFPLPAGYIRGMARGIISAKTALSLGIFLVAQGMVCNQHLFVYRYCLISGKTFFNPWIGGFLAWSYLWVALTALLTYTATTDTYKTLEEWKTEYPICVYEVLTSVPDIFAFDKMEVLKKTLIPLVYGILAFLTWMPLLTRKCIKLIEVEVMSDNLRRMHRKFLFQLTVQAAVPFLLVEVPLIVAVNTVIFEISGLSFINDLICCTCSLFGVSGGIILIIMNENYHNLLTRFLPCKSRGEVTAAPSSIGPPSRTNGPSSVIVH